MLLFEINELVDELEKENNQLKMAMVRLNTSKDSWIRVAKDLESQLTTAREAGAREMRKACIEITRKFMCREDTVIGAEEIEAEIIALPVHPADGAKDE